MKRYFYLLLLLLLPWAAANAANPQKQAQLQSEIRQLSVNLDSQKDVSDSWQAEVTQLEKKLSDVAQQLYRTEEKIDATRRRLQENSQKKLKYEADLDSQKAGLAQQLQALYAAGEQSHLRLLLRQDEPSEISRNIRYFEYMNKSRITRIQSIQKTLNELNVTRAAIDKDYAEFQVLNKQQKQQQAEIETTLSARSSSLNKLNSDMRSKQKRLDKLHAADASLQQIIEQLNQQPEKAPEDEASPPRRQPDPRPTTKAPNKSEPQGIAVNTSLTPNKPFSSLKGALSWPTQGKVIHGYGSPRNEKQRWDGVVIAAAGGTKVKAVAKGRVSFAGWMNGYGHLIIIDHDNKYMSLYGYNRAVYKKEGAVVNANETIATVGNSGGQNQDSLYFAIRQGTSPQNPARWCR
ncbi:MAG: peptidoglycan DD-metalloendopeptidase family protein [Thiothrix sp.]|uniref:murein hydrolase activator EnvC family protein n=1 Tax=Thiothrix sp. TaxID=1032 RepID=UPI002625796B|nr:peptidoglycan DD-metalloendopeptidase family protein [Thiothrix sp.]MDD5391451.1 peptidoglycan DD-metalloendopeptidase family protein [Thiothrix sp.]